MSKEFTKKVDHSAIGVVFSKDQEQVLLIKRRDVPVWVLPGGGIDEGENPQEAVIREVLEETGFGVDIERKVGEYTPVNRLTRFTHLYLCNILKGSPTISSETKEVRFHPINKLPKLLPPPYGEWIKEATKKNKDLIKRDLVSVSYFSLVKSILPSYFGAAVLSCPHGIPDQYLDHLLRIDNLVKLLFGQ